MIVKWKHWLRGTSTLWLGFRAKIQHFFSTEWHKISQWFFLHVVRLFLKIKNIFIWKVRKTFSRYSRPRTNLSEGWSQNVTMIFHPRSTQIKKRNTGLISSVLAFFRDISFPKFWNEAKRHLFVKKMNFLAYFR